MSDNENDIFFIETLNYYQQNKDKLRKYNREYYKRRQESDNPIYISGQKKKSTYISGEKIMCDICGSIIRSRWIKFHQDKKSCKNPRKLPLKKRNLLNLRNTIDSDDDEYFKL